MEEQPIRFRAILEIVGKPAEHVTKQLSAYLEKIKEDDNLMVMEQKEHEPAEKEGYFSTFAELEIVVKSGTHLVGFCVDYMPSSVEIIKPDAFSLKQVDFTNFTNDLLAKLHRVDMVAKQRNIENQMLSRNLQRMLENTILVSIRFGVNTYEKLQKSTGVEKLEPFLEDLMKQKKVKKDGDVYAIA